MKIKVFQLYFHKDQIEYYREPEFYPFDNTANLTPDLREYPLLKKCRDIAIQEKLDLWGAVSWNYRFKYEISSTDLLKLIKNIPGYDAYLVNAFANHVPLIYNVWEQGQWCHPHMLHIMEEVFPLMGFDKELLYHPMDRRSIFWGSSAIANLKFWDAYFEFADKFVLAIDKLSPNTKKLYHGNTAYIDRNISYFSFIQERLFSTFVYINQKKFNILPLQINEEQFEPHLDKLTLLKTIAIERQDRNILNDWRIIRNQYVGSLYPNYTDLAEQWIYKSFKYRKS